MNRLLLLTLLTPFLMTPLPPSAQPDSPESAVPGWKSGAKRSVSSRSTATDTPTSATPAGATRLTVSAMKGNVVAARAGKQVRLTSSGHDSEAVLSPDGSVVAFVRTDSGKQVETATGEVDSSSIWLVQADGTNARKLVADRPEVRTPEETMAAFHNLRFSLDGKTLYFAGSGWATSGALKAVDLVTGKVRHLAPCNGFELLRRGRYKGHFVAFLHKYNEQGAYDSCWLLSPEGREIRDVRKEELEEAVRQLEME